MLQSGHSALFDTFQGLVPVKVLSIKGTDGIASSAQTVQFEITEDYRSYRKGEKLSRPAIWVIPTKAVVLRQHQYRILPYAVQCDA